MTKLSNFQNKSFIKAIRIIRRWMPTLAIVLLLSVYVVSAAVAGDFLESLTGWTIKAYAIGAAIQATRALLVFFPMLNPNRPNFSQLGEIIAIIMGIISIGEIITLINSAGMEVSVAFSLTVLMAAGVGVEIFLLKEIKFATELELFSDRQYWEGLKEFYQDRAEFQRLLTSLELGEQSPNAGSNGHADFAEVDITSSSRSRNDLGNGIQFQ